MTTDPLTAQQNAIEDKRKERHSKIVALRCVGDICEMPGWRELTKEWEASLKNTEQAMCNHTESAGWLELGKLQGRAAVYRELLQRERKTWEKITALSNEGKNRLPLDQ